jgi:protein SCO1/2
VSYTGKADIGGDWTLYNTKGEEVTQKDFAGKYYLIYFGFTYCPDICPVSMIKMAKALKSVRESKEFRYFDLEALFVSVDPDRDSP